MESRRRLHSLGRAMATILWFRVDDGWIYYVVVGGYAAIVSTALWLLTRHGWLPILVGFAVLLDGMTGLLVLLNRWLTRRWQGPS